MYRNPKNILVGCIVVLCSQLMASSEFNQKRMDRDLRIMEGVLDKLFQGKNEYTLWNGSTKALQIPDYGVIFHTSRHGPVYSTMDISLERYKDNIRIISERIRNKAERMKRVEIDEKVVDEVSDALEHVDLDFIREPHYVRIQPEKIIEKEKESIDSFKENITLFFENYASAIGQLEPTHRIAVLINLKDWEMTDTESTFLTSWVSKRDIDSYREGQITANHFKQRIHFDLADSESDIDMDIDILNEILDRALHTSHHGMTSNSGLYLSGLGAILFMEMPSLHIISSDSDTPVSVIISDRVNRAISHSYGRSRNIEEEVIHTEDRVSEIHDELFELIASYGHTLRIQPKDRIILKVNLGSGHLYWSSGKKEPSHLLLQLRKEDVDGYSKGIVTRDELRRRLISQTF